MQITDSIRILKGVGEKVEQNLNKLSIHTIEDLMEFYPRTYVTYEEPIYLEDVVVGKRQAVFGWLQKSPSRIPGGRVEKTIALLNEGSNKLQLIWYRMPYLRKQLIIGKNYIFHGVVKDKNGQWTMEQPEIYEPDNYMLLQSKILPVYSLTEGVRQKLLAKLTRQILDQNTLFHDYLPEDLRIELELAEYNYALEQIHYPKDWETLKIARKRLAFDEFFLFALSIQRLKTTKQSTNSSHMVSSKIWADLFLESLSYRLTNAQMKSWTEIYNDLASEKVMNRLLQGDVGSGKTVIAQLALLTMVESGFQGCLMVPTEVLAKQHYDSFVNDFKLISKKVGQDIRIGLLTGSLTAKEKREIYKAISMHEIDILIGTHAVIQDKVKFSNLGIVITDEQHRFGVNQREWLLDKGVYPHVLVMSATPIPRTLAIILYGDLDISVIDELPASRKPIKNCVVGTSYRPAAYNFIQNQVKNGRQVYIICPMVEESEFMDLENVIDYTDKLKKILPSNIRVEYLHGKMKNKEKEMIMERYYNKEIDVLVSTTVIEVGINVPNATVMMVENSERFGLAQLHQLRGRIGRGEEQSYCIFMQGSDSEKAKKRLNILVESNDGFYIASEDLKLRGPGDMFGIKQSGLIDFHIADLYQDSDLLKLAGECAKRYETHIPSDLLRRIERYMQLSENDIIL